MHIVIDARLILPEMTGIGRYLLGLIRGLDALITNETVEVWVQDTLPSDHPFRRSSFNKVNLRWLNIPHNSVSQLWQLPIHLIEHRPDILHVPHFNIPIFSPGKLVVTIHNLLYFYHPEFLGRWSWLKGKIVQNLTLYAVHRATKVVTVSQFLKETLLALTNIPPEKITVIHHGIDLDQFQHFDQKIAWQLLERYQISPPYLLFVGERRPHKNLLTLIEAFRLFQELSKQQYSLVIVGKPYANYREPEGCVKDLHLDPKVYFIGHQQGEYLNSLYHLADAFILLSKYEGFGLPLLEAMAAGIPVVASNCTAIPEVVGDAGILVSPDDARQAVNALLKVIPGGELRETLIARGKERVKQFTWERCARRTLDVYHAALKADPHV